MHQKAVSDPDFKAFPSKEAVLAPFRTLSTTPSLDIITFKNKDTPLLGRIVYNCILNDRFGVNSICLYIKVLVYDNKFQHQFVSGSLPLPSPSPPLSPS